MRDTNLIVINGVSLTEGQSTTVRIALQEFLKSLTPGSMGDDQHGHVMVQGYTDRANEVLDLIFPK